MLGAWAEFAAGDDQFRGTRPVFWGGKTIPGDLVRKLPEFTSKGEAFETSDQKFVVIGEAFGGSDQKFVVIGEAVGSCDRKFVVICDTFGGSDQKFVVICDTFGGSNREFLFIWEAFGGAILGWRSNLTRFFTFAGGNGRPMGARAKFMGDRRP